MKWTTLPLLALVGCSDTDPSTVADAPGVSALSSEEIAGLQFSREEEKLARDVYGVLTATGPIFSNIQASEQRHFDAIGGLLVAYDLADPAEGRSAGEFQDPELATLYEELVQRGAPGGLDALGVGCTIEELDLHDLAIAQTTVEHPDLDTVYDNLALGSRNHLRAFYSKLIADGGSYTPIWLEQTTFDAIVTSPKEQGGN
jgi:hypothetical protein